MSGTMRGQVAPRLRHLADGRGFATIDQSGLIGVHPVLDDVHDPIGYLAREFSEPLTPAQRRAYFIE